MDRDKLHSLLRKMESEAQAALSEDVSFLEALHVLKCEIDSNRQVRAAMRALRDRGMRVFASLKPRIRVTANAGETVLQLPEDGPEPGLLDDALFEDASQRHSEPLMRKMLDAATAVLASSPHCRYLEKIISEAVQANGAFERMARSIENAGYELRICLDLSTYAHVHPRESDREDSPDCYAPQQACRMEPLLQESAKSGFLPLSDPDAQFLKNMRISLE